MLAIIESEFTVDAMTIIHFTKLLLWYGVKKSEMGTKPQMKQKYKTMIESSKGAPIAYFKWTSADKDDLAKLKAKEIAIGDTALGQLRDTHKSDFEVSYKPMTPRSKSYTIRRFKQWHNQVNGKCE